MDKLAFGAAMGAAGLPTLPRILISADQEPNFAAPYICKPRFGGSSIGIEVVSDWATALALVGSSPFYVAGGVAEPFLDNSRDLQVGVRTWPEVQLSAVEEPVRSGTGIYSYSQKYLAWGGEVSGGRQLPAQLDAALSIELRRMALAVTRAGGLRGICRIDFLERGGDLFVNEVNTIPGSMAAYLWIDPKLSRKELFSAMIEEAMSVGGRRFSISGADGSALRNAGAIASKLS
jgi:D-alanine-D-alanine ligase